MLALQVAVATCIDTPLNAFMTRAHTACCKALVVALENMCESQKLGLIFTACNFKQGSMECTRCACMQLSVGLGADKCMHRCRWQALTKVSCSSARAAHLYVAMPVKATSDQFSVVMLQGTIGSATL